MHSESRKIHLIEEILKIENETVLSEVETIIVRSKLPGNTSRRSFRDFAGMMTNEEANELEKIIKTGCEQIHPDDWK